MYYNTITANMCTPENKENTARKFTKRRKRKHIPHAQRSSEYVERRNKRERTRIRAVNEAFERLRERVPSCAQDPDLRISKMEILTHAIGYIEGLCGSLGYRDFAEYCRWEGQRTVPGRGKENPGQELQDWGSATRSSSPALLPVCNGGLRERHMNVAGPASDFPSPVPAHPRGSMNTETPLTLSRFQALVELYDVGPIIEHFDFLSDQSFDVMDNDLWSDFTECRHFTAGQPSDNSLCREPSYVPLKADHMTDANVDSFMTFPHVTKFCSIRTLHS